MLIHELRRALRGGVRALPVYVRDKMPDVHAQMHYYFCDTGEELPETYEYLNFLETYLGKPIARLNPTRPFSHYLKIYGDCLPSPRMRWCTAQLKIKPFEDWLARSFGEASIDSYVAIRADEDRDGYISHKPNIRAVYPFKDAGIGKEDVYRLLEEAGVGVPKYYEWRTRSGCYFCFFQRKSEWVGLKERHPDLYEKAKSFEHSEVNPRTGQQQNFTWSQNESLTDLELPERMEGIKRDHAVLLAREAARRRPARLLEMFEEALDAEDDTEPCMICNL